MTVMASVIQGVAMVLVGILYDKVAPAASWIFVLGMLALSFVLGFVLLFRDKKRYPALYQPKEVSAEEPAGEKQGEDP